MPTGMRTTPGIFVTGTDTGIGKTRAAVALIEGFVADGFRVAGMKPVAAGIDAGASANADVLALAQAANVAASLSDINPYAFAPATAPHLAASRAGVTIDLDRCAQACGRLAAAADVVVVEGAGGVLVPLGARQDMLDLPRRLGLPVVLVVGIRLGCINHALLSALAIRARGLIFAGWIANRIDPRFADADASAATLAAALGAPLMADIAFAAGVAAPPIRGVAAFLGVAPVAP
jgi:dethiobiotin synthetase